MISAYVQESQIENAQKLFDEMPQLAPDIFDTGISVCIEVDNFVNIVSMLRQLYTCFDHPNPYRRLGAAMTAHLIYPVLRENGSIVDHHILEILFF